MASRPEKSTAIKTALQVLEDGGSLREAARQTGVTEQSLRRWFREDEYAAQYTRARDVGLDVLADQIEGLIEDAKPLDRIEMDKLRLLVDTKKWRLSKLAPKRYGDRLELAGDSDAPLRVEYVNALKARQEKGAA
jgi:hypothetical protein